MVCGQGSVFLMEEEEDGVESKGKKRVSSDLEGKQGEWLGGRGRVAGYTGMESEGRTCSVWWREDPRQEPSRLERRGS